MRAKKKRLVWHRKSNESNRMAKKMGPQDTINPKKLDRMIDTDIDYQEHERNEEKSYGTESNQTGNH